MTKINKIKSIAHFLDLEVKDLYDEEIVNQYSSKN